MRYKVGSRWRNLSVTHEQFVREFIKVVSEGKFNELLYKNIRSKIASNLKIRMKDVDELFFSIYYYSPTLRNSLWIFPSFSNEGSRILKKSKLEGFDELICSSSMDSMFGWDSIGWKGDLSENIVGKIVFESKPRKK